MYKKETGFRKVEYDINNGGLRINDKSVYLKGYAQRSTNEWAVIGVANDWLTDIDMQLIKESNYSLTIVSVLNYIIIVNESFVNN